MPMLRTTPLRETIAAMFAMAEQEKEERWRKARMDFNMEHGFITPYETIAKNFTAWYLHATDQDIFSLMVDPDCPKALKAMVRRAEANKEFEGEWDYAWGATCH